MCLAVPGLVTAIQGDNQAVVDFMGVSKVVSLDLMERVRTGDYVIVHAGFVITTLNIGEALETIRHFKQLQNDIG